VAPGRIALMTCALAFGVITPAPAQNPPITYVVLGEQGAVARALVPARQGGPAPGCPAIIVNGTAQTMDLRSAPSSKFPIVVCEFPLPASTASAAILGQALPLPPAALNSIAVFGDTGCRIKAEKAAPEQVARDADEEEADESKGKEKVQDCSDPKLWPFKPMSKTIAKAKPDLVIHVGDYLYRESKCPADRQQDCKGSPYGDNWDTWLVDFFAPAQPLLQVAPWIVTRGNHEICTRAGTGYALLLDPTPASTAAPACRKLIPQYTVTIAGRSFIVLDSSDAPDTCPNSGCDSTAYEEQFAAMKPAAGTWLVTHRPIWGFTYSKNKDTGERELGIRNMTLQAALEKKWKNVPPAGIELVLSGHIHLWEALSFEDGRTPQFVLGAGGTDLAHKLPKDKHLEGQKIGGTRIAAIASDDEFGYTLFQPSKQGRHWNATFYDTTGQPILGCKVEPTKATCK